MVQTKAFAPFASEVTPELALDGFVTIAIPSEVHAPIPGADALPDNVAVVLAQIP